MNQRTKKSPLNNTTRTGTILAVDVNGDGKRVRVDLSSIRPSDFTAHHGTAPNGNQVNSIHSAKIGKSTILRSGAKGPAIAATDDEIDVFAIKWLSDKGFTVSAANTGLMISDRSTG